MSERETVIAKRWIPCHRWEEVPACLGTRLYDGIFEHLALWAKWSGLFDSPRAAGRERLLAVSGQPVEEGGEEQRIFRVGMGLKDRQIGGLQPADIAGSPQNGSQVRKGEEQ
jgi:hypothetical protein